LSAKKGIHVKVDLIVLRINATDDLEANAFGDVLLRLSKDGKSVYE